MKLKILAICFLLFSAGCHNDDAIVPQPEKIVLSESFNQERLISWHQNRAFRLEILECSLSEFEKFCVDHGLDPERGDWQIAIPAPNSLRPNGSLAVYLIKSYRVITSIEGNMVKCIMSEDGKLFVYKFFPE